MDFNKFFASFKNSWALPIAVLCLAIAFVSWKSDFSLIDMVADRVIERIDAKYSPYGPQPPQQAQGQPQKVRKQP